MRTEQWVQIRQMARCDSCGHEFRPRVRVITDTLAGETWMFRCPSCRRRFDMVSIKPRGIEIRAELARVRMDTEADAELRAARLVELQAALAREVARGSDAGAGPVMATLIEAQSMSVDEEASDVEHGD